MTTKAISNKPMDYYAKIARQGRKECNSMSKAQRRENIQRAIEQITKSGHASASFTPAGMR
ncbi:MAG: hypothetical protein LBH01_02120 [Verrucomicrobiales bacterium]|jgi:hypothetical protein|nr:hypothetical protein [Verrucomicrobiales bacterium]